MATKKEEKLGAWALVSGSKKDRNAVYGVKVWAGQGATTKGEIVKVINRFGQTTLVRLDAEIGHPVGSNLGKGEMGYTLYSVEK